jgi:hypothetical protein
MKSLILALKKQPIVYVTLDLERTLAINLQTAGYYVITNDEPFSRKVASHNKNILLIKSKYLLSTRELLEHPQTHAFVSKLTDPHILVFKNTSIIEQICKKNNWKLLNPPATLATVIEEKISQITWLGPLAKLLPPHQVKLCKELRWQDKKICATIQLGAHGKRNFFD